MTEDELRKFDKEVLVKYLFREPFYSNSVLLDKLQSIERDLKFKQLMNKNRELLKMMQQYTENKDHQKWYAAFAKSEKISKQINKLLEM